MYFRLKLNDLFLLNPSPLPTPLSTVIAVLSYSYDAHPGIGLAKSHHFRRRLFLPQKQKRRIELSFSFMEQNFTCVAYVYVRSDFTLLLQISLYYYKGVARGGLWGLGPLRKVVYFS